MLELGLGTPAWQPTKKPVQTGQTFVNPHSGDNVLAEYLLSFLALTEQAVGQDSRAVLDLIVSGLLRHVPCTATVAQLALPPANNPINFLKLGDQPFAPIPLDEWRDFAQACSILTAGSEQAAIIGSPQGPLKVVGLQADCGGHGVRLWFGSNCEEFASAQQRVLQQAAVSLLASGLYTARIDHERVHASRAKDEFLAMLGHELRNPLAPMVNALDLISLKGSGPLAKQHAILGRQVDHLIRLVDDLLDITRITREVVVLKREVITIGSVLLEALERSAGLIKEKKHQVILKPEALQGCVLADPDRLRQVFMNLLINACKYTPAGGVITVMAQLEAGPDPLLAVSVQDNGMGIEPDLLPRVFDLFEQGPMDSHRAQGGLGIGLAIVKKLLALHGGSVAAHSEGQGQGATFTCRMPLAPAASSEAMPPALDMRVPLPIPLRVMLVDDSSDILETMADFLRAYEFEVLAFGHPHGAIKHACDFNADVYILDIGMPDMDGYQLVKELRQLDGNNAWFVALTGYGRRTDKERALAAGFDVHFAKPVDTQVLLESIIAAAGRRCSC